MVAVHGEEHEHGADTWNKQVYHKPPAGHCHAEKRSKKKCHEWRNKDNANSADFVDCIRGIWNVCKNVLHELQDHHVSQEKSRDRIV